MSELEAKIDRMTEWARKVNARLDAIEKRLDAQHQADQNRGLEKAMTGKDSSDKIQFPAAFEGLEIAPVPEDYDGKFSTWAPDNDNNQMRIIANLDALANPCYTEQYGGEDYNIVPIISKSNKAQWIAVRATADTNAMEGKFEGVNYGEALSYIAFDDLLAVRGKQTDIDIDAWEVRTRQRDAETAPQYDASDDPF